MISILQGVAWPYAVSGLLVGVLVGLTGVGGGSLMTPLLVLLFGVNPTTAVGTDLLFAAVTKGVGTALHGRRGSVDWRIVGRLALGSVPATALTVVLVNRHDHARHGHADVVTVALGLALILTSVGLVLRRQLVERLAPSMDTLGERTRTILTIALGAFLGVLVSITSVGAGAIGVTVLLVLYPRLTTLRIVGSDIAHAVPLTLVAGAGHWFYGSVDFTILGSLLVGSIPGIALGSTASGHVPDRILRPLLAATLAIVGVRLAI